MRSLLVDLTLLDGYGIVSLFKVADVIDLLLSQLLRPLLRKRGVVH